MSTDLHSQTTFADGFPCYLAAFKFVGIGFFISLLLLWGFLQGLIFLAERYSNMISRIDWWKSGMIALTGMIVFYFSWQLPGMIGGESTVTTSMTSSLICGTFVAWIMCGRLYSFEFLHRLIVSVGVPVFIYCSVALGKVMAWKMGGN